MVPIPRTTRDELIQSSFSFNNHSLAQTSSSSRSAYVFVDASFGPYYGVSGATSMYNPKVDKGQSSEGYLYVKNGEGDGTNMIVIGWNVSPDLYNDDATHIYSRWTSDNFKTTGCYNMLCKGFVQTDKYYFGSRVEKTSTYDGKMVEMPISLFQDPTTKNWWVKVVNITIGYFPATLFSNMANANEVGWGGRTVTPAGASSPSMGSGHLPDDDFKHACYFRYISYQSVARKDLGPEYYMVGKFNDAPKSCYEVEFYGDQRGQVGYSMQFGGPGGNCGT
ncbi:uncharacterized protein [Medicago truncatula]|nr:uncharacterized protein LOC11425868 [Medicago truncatula]